MAVGIGCPYLRAGRGGSPQLRDQGENALPDEHGNDAVYPPGEVLAEEEHVEKRRHRRAQEDGAPEHDLRAAFLRERPDHAE